MWYTWIVNNFDEPNLIPSNIKDGVDIFGVEGSFEWGGSGSLGNRQTVVDWLYTIQYKQIWNIFIFWNIICDVQNWISNPIASSELTRERLKTLLVKDNIDDYKEQDIWWYNQHWWWQYNVYWWQSTAHLKILVAMTLS